MADISQITLSSGSTYDIKDTIVKGAHYIGVTTTSLTTGSTTNPILINGSNHTNVAGDLVNMDIFEFIWDGTKWIKYS